MTDPPLLFAPAGVLHDNNLEPHHGPKPKARTAKRRDRATGAAVADTGVDSAVRNAERAGLRCPGSLFLA